MKDLLHKNLIFHTKEADQQKYIIRGVFSTSDEDRQGESIDQTGWNLEEFKQNPVILFAHDHYIPAVAKAIDIGINSQGQMEGGIQFAAEEDTSGLARTLWNLYSNKFMRAFSVGFANDVVEIGEDDSVVLRKNTLYEISCVNVPANAMALAKGMGIDTGSIRKAVMEARATEKAQQTISEKEADNKAIEIQLNEEDIAKISNQVAKRLRADKALQLKGTETPGSQGRIHSLRRSVNRRVRALLKSKKRTSI